MIFIKNINNKSTILKKVFVCILILISIISILVATYLVYKNSQEKLLRDEVFEINEILSRDPLDEDKLNEKLNRVVTKNEYAKVEKAYKEFLKANEKNLEEILEFYENDKTNQILNIENIKEDMPEFKKSKELLANSKNKLISLKEEYDKLFDEKISYSYINKYKLKKYYINYYKVQLIGNLKSSEVEKKLSNQLTKQIETKDKINKILDFLIENKNHYKIYKNEVNFESQELLDEYIKLTGDIY